MLILSIATAPTLAILAMAVKGYISYLSTVSFQQNTQYFTLSLYIWNKM